MGKTKRGYLGTVSMYKGAKSYYKIFASRKSHDSSSYVEVIDYSVDDFYEHPEKISAMNIVEEGTGLFKKVKTISSFSPGDVKSVIQTFPSTISGCSDFDIELNNGDKIHVLIYGENFIENIYEAKTLDFFKKIFKNVLNVTD